MITTLSLLVFALAIGTLCMAGLAWRSDIRADRAEARAAEAEQESALSWSKGHTVGCQEQAALSNARWEAEVLQRVAKAREEAHAQGYEQGCQDGWNDCAVYRRAADIRPSRAA